MQPAPIPDSGKDENEPDTYVDDLGRLVFTAAYHRRRGFCCGNKCRHCPFDWVNVPQRLRTPGDQAPTTTCNVQTTTKSR
jgi:hypothetical protein